MPSYKQWSKVPAQAREDLLEWLNFTEPSSADRARLAELYLAGNFHAWDCPTCGERVYWGEPDDWGHFQGVLQAAYASFPGCPEHYSQQLIAQQCDSCRMRCPSLSDLNLTGIGAPVVWGRTEQGD